MESLRSSRCHLAIAIDRTGLGALPVSVNAVSKPRLAHLVVHKSCDSDPQPHALEGRSVVWTNLLSQAPGHGRSHGLAALLQPVSAALDAGPCQPNVVRVKMACQSTQTSQLATIRNPVVGHGI